MGRTARAARHVLLVALAGLVTIAAAAGAEIQPGAVELGLGGSLTALEGSTQIQIATRSGSFLRAGPGLGGVELEISYSRVSELDLVDVLGSISWHPTSWQPTYPFLSVGGGWRQEWLGSFRQARFPVGFSLGVRHLVGPRLGLRLEYRFQRILDDPVAAFNEQRLLFGLSWFLRNAPVS